MSIKGSSYGNFRRALRTGNLTVIRAAAAELPAINLEDAFSICLLLAKQEPHNFERAVLRWIGRYCLERRDLTIEDVRDVADAFAITTAARTCRIAQGDRGSALLLSIISIRRAADQPTLRLPRPRAKRAGESRGGR